VSLGQHRERKLPETCGDVVYLGVGFRLAKRELRLPSPAARSAFAEKIATSRDPYDDLSDRAYTERNISRGRMGGQFRIRIRYRIYRTPWWDFLTVSQHELSELVAGTGWEVARLIRGPDGRYAAILQKG
jgi:hypothetical protein